VEEILHKAQQEKEKLVIQKLNALIADYEIKSNVEIAKIKRENFEKGLRKGPEVHNRK